MSENNERINPDCDPEDLMCQFQIQANLEGIKKAVGTDKFKDLYPEFAGLEDAINKRLEEQDSRIADALAKCGMRDVAEEGEQDGAGEV